MEPYPWKIPGLSSSQIQNFVGDALYPRIKALHPKDAGKLTGMIVSGFSIEELHAIATIEAEFQATVAKAKEVLDTHRQRQGQQSK